MTDDLTAPRNDDGPVLQAERALPFQSDDCGDPVLLATRGDLLDALFHGALVDGGQIFKGGPTQAGKICFRKTDDVDFLPRTLLDHRGDLVEPRAEAFRQVDRCQPDA